MIQNCWGTEKFHDDQTWVLQLCFGLSAGSVDTKFHSTHCFHSSRITAFLSKTRGSFSLPANGIETVTNARTLQRHHCTDVPAWPSFSRFLVPGEATWNRFCLDLLFLLLCLWTYSAFIQQRRTLILILGLPRSRRILVWRLTFCHVFERAFPSFSCSWHVGLDIDEKSTWLTWNLNVCFLREMLMSWLFSLAWKEKQLEHWNSNENMAKGGGAPFVCFCFGPK